MKVRFWGTRGSIPVSLTAPDVRSKLLSALQGAQGIDLASASAREAYVDSLGFDVAGTFGGHSSCVQLDVGHPEHVILDLGTGVRALGQHMLARFGPAAPQTYHVFMSHLHWDHIMGLPFFTPVYIPGNRIVIHSCHPHVEFALRRQQAEPSFPVRFDQFSARMEFDVMQPGVPASIAGTRVTAHAQRHAGDSYGWRFEHGGKCVVYSTDSEHRLEDEQERAGFIRFFERADLVIFDAMYSLADAISVKADWGHSSNIVAVELCQAARARTLAMFHHEPGYSDTQIARVLQETRRFEEITRDGHALEVLSAWDGLELTLVNRWTALFGRVFLYQRGRAVALIFLLLYAVLLALADDAPAPGADPTMRQRVGATVAAPVAAVRQYLFDSYQRVFPRERQAQSVAIVGIDENSLKIVGQWPWPRNKLAELIDAIAQHRPAAIGLDIYMPEPDQTSPEQVARRLAPGQEVLAGNLRLLPTHDDRLAQALHDAPTVLGAAGFQFETLATTVGMRTFEMLLAGDDPRPFLPRYPFVLASLPQLQAATHGQALVSIELAAVVRRVALVAAVGAQVTPSLAMEMLRVGYNQGPITVQADHHGIRSVSVADQHFATQGRGDIWLHFAPERQGEGSRNISAVDLLAGKISSAGIENKLVLIGLTGSGLNDRRVTPLRESVAGIEIQAQVLESMFDRRLLLRPWWMVWVECAVLLVVGAGMVWAAPNGLRRATGGRSIRQLRLGWWVSLVCVVVLASGFWLFVQQGWLFDGAGLAVGFASLLASLVSSSTLEVERDNRRLAQEQQQLREEAARLAGEMEAARRIQLGSLPNATRAFPGETRFAIDAVIEPAREVGGDLYDFFMVDERHLCFLIGDVSGKGVPASLFMAVTKALTRSFATRLAGGPAEIVSAANLDLSRENVETLFVTLLLGVLDVETGQLELVNAGHDGPWRLGADGHLQQVLAGPLEGGPPLCVVDDFSYQVHRVQLAPGDRLCMVTDGITEATNAAQDLYGSARLRDALAALDASADAGSITRQVREDVGRFVAGAEPSDDLAILVLHWKGPTRAPAGEISAG